LASAGVVTRRILEPGTEYTITTDEESVIRNYPGYNRNESIWIDLHNDSSPGSLRVGSLWFYNYQTLPRNFRLYGSFEASASDFTFDLISQEIQRADGDHPEMIVARYNIYNNSNDMLATIRIEFTPGRYQWDIDGFWHFFNGIGYFIYLEEVYSSDYFHLWGFQVSVSWPPFNQEVIERLWKLEFNQPITELVDYTLRAKLSGHILEGEEFEFFAERIGFSEALESIAANFADGVIGTAEMEINKDYMRMNLTIDEEIFRAVGPEFAAIAWAASGVNVALPAKWEDNRTLTVRLTHKSLLDIYIEHNPLEIRDFVLSLIMHYLTGFTMIKTGVQELPGV